MSNETPPANADPVARASDAAATALARLAREQDAVVPHDSPVPCETCDIQARALATSRGEAVAALEALEALALPGFEGTAAAVQAALLGADCDVASDTLDAWAAGWSAFAGSAS